MNLRSMAVKAEKMLADNSPAILTAIGVTGTITTAYLTGKATFKAAKIISDEQFKQNLQEKGHNLDNKEKFGLVWQLYLPAVSTGALTCTAIVFASKIGTRRAAAMAAAYTVRERAFAEYKDKVVERLGDKEEKELRDEIASETVLTMPPQAINGVALPGHGTTLCHEAMTGRYFMCDMEALRRAENNVNRQIMHDGYASLTMFYNNIDGLEPTSVSEELGWNTDKGFELLFSSVLTNDGKPCLSFDYAVVPIRDYWRFC